MTSNAASSAATQDASASTEDAPVDTQDETPEGDTPTAAESTRPERDLALVPDAPEPDGPDPAGLHGRAREARERLTPARAVIPAPRSPQGVTVPPAFGGADEPPAAVVTALDGLVADLAAVRADPDAPAHHALVRIGELTAAGIPEEGWSRAERLDPEILTGAAELASSLHTSAAALLERLDAAELPSPAVVIDSVVTSLLVMRMVADLEVFARRSG